MSVHVRVIEVNKANKTVIVEAYEGSRKIMRSPMKYTKYDRKSIEGLIKKACKAFDSPQWGGYDVLYLISFEK